MAVSIEWDPDGPEPKYRQLAKILRAQIEAGKILPNRAIPAEKVLQDEYGVGRDTVRRAVDLLREWDLVETVHPKGTFVKPRPAEESAENG